MDPTAILPLLDKGGWGTAALCLGGIVYLFKALQRCQQDRIDDGKAISVALTEARLANVAVAAALESRTGYFERLGGQVEEAKQDTDTNLRLVQASLSEIQRSLEDLRRRRA